MSFLAESLFNPVVLNVGEIAPLVTMGKRAIGGETTNGDENARSLIDH